MASVGPFVAAGVEVFAAGTLAWQDLLNMRVADNQFAYVIDGNQVCRDTVIQLYRGLAAIGNNKATLAYTIDPPDPAEYRSYSGDGTYWGTALTPSVVNDNSLAVLVKWGSGTSPERVTDTIRLYSFNGGSGLGVPADATNISLNVEFLVGPNNGGDFYPGIDNVRITVTYTPAASSAKSLMLTGCGS